MKIIKLLSYLAVAAFFIFVIYFSIRGSNLEEERREAALQAFSRDVKGVVVKKIKLNFSGQGGVVVIKNDQVQNVPYSDLNDRFLFCRITRQYSYLATTYYDNYHLDDSVFVDSKKKTITISNEKSKDVITLFLIEGPLKEAEEVINEEVRLR